LQRGQIIGTAADAGLTFSTKRKIAEQRLAEDNQGLVESTTRQYNAQLAQLEAERQHLGQQLGLGQEEVQQQYQFATEGEQIEQESAERQIQEARENVQRKFSQRIAELETQAERGDVTARAEMQDLQRRLKQSIQSTGLTAEKFLGTENVQGIAGITPLGGIKGSLAEEKVKDKATRRSAIYGELTQQSLPV